MSDTDNSKACPAVVDEEWLGRLIASHVELLAACKELKACAQPARDWHELMRARSAIRDAEALL